MAAAPASRPNSPPDGATAVLVLADGTLAWGHGAGAEGEAVGEVCFNTAMTGYQEILTDPSYAGQMITFTFPHIGNVGSNPEDMESADPAARGFILRESVTVPANFRANQGSGGHFSDWARKCGLVGITGVDTRRLTRHIRMNGAPNGVVAHRQNGKFDVPALLARARAWPGLEGMDLAREVSTRQSYTWDEGLWALGKGYAAKATNGSARFHVVAVDYGIKRNILRCLVSIGARVTVVPCDATAEDILAHKPDGVFLSNGPGDPAATGEYAIPILQDLIASGTPIFGICLGHQLLALALGATTTKMHQGHRGANHPVKDLTTGKVEITSMNHGFTVEKDGLPDGLAMSHVSLFDGSLCGLEVTGKPIFSVQYHPEASPGPMDSHYLFSRFAKMMEGG